MSVSMAWERNPATKLIADIKIQISLPPGFPEKYRTAVVRAADQCAVKKHLLDAPAIEVVAV
jgi:ribosomal protein S12 methylthiotransferase accessory factor